MNVISKIVTAILLCTCAFGSVNSSESSGVRLVALGCELNIPIGYILHWQNGGYLTGSYVGDGAISNPVFHFHPVKAIDAQDNGPNEILSETKLGKYRYAKIKGYGPVNWNVVSDEEASFASWDVPNDPFISQLTKCAQK